MRLFTLIVTSLLCASVWLVLLVASGFSSLAVAVGALGVLVVTGRSA